MSNILKNHALRIFQAGVKAVDPEMLVARKLKINGTTLTDGRNRYDLSEYRQILVLGGGKAAGLMARAVDSLLADYPVSGLAVTSRGSAVPDSRITVVEAGHPTPDRDGQDAAEQILKLVENANEKTLIICIISGGASALMTAPAYGIALEDLRVLTGELLACGADIHEINCVRKHISRIKGGRLALTAAPAQVLTLLISDVPGDPLDVIASGPTVPDSTTYQDAENVINKYNLVDKIPVPVTRYLEAGKNGAFPETPKPGDPVFLKTANLLLGTNRDALSAAAEEAEKLGYRCTLTEKPVTGEARDVAVRDVTNALKFKRETETKRSFIAGGETTVTIKGTGKGGRNQEYVLSAAIHLDGKDGITVLSAGTDGIDGPTDAAGAVADGLTCDTGRSMGLDPHVFLDNNDSYTFFDRTGSLIRTGPTNTNVMDLRVILIKGSSNR